MTTLYTLRRLLPVPALAGLLILGGCLGGGRPAPTVIDQYVLEYPGPQPAATAPLATTITVERFMGIPPYTSTAMVYQPAPLIRDEYRAHRWRSTPADLVNACLLRDIRGAGIFRGVFSYRDADSSRYRLKGTVDEFLEQADEQGRQAVLAITATLVDASADLPERQLLFQREYRVVQAFTDKTPSGFALAMSRAMARVSAQVRADIRAALGG